MTYIDTYKQFVYNTKIDNTEQFEYNKKFEIENYKGDYSGIEYDKFFIEILEKNINKNKMDNEIILNIFKEIIKKGFEEENTDDEERYHFIFHMMYIFFDFIDINSIILEDDTKYNLINICNGNKNMIVEHIKNYFEDKDLNNLFEKAKEAVFENKRILEELSEPIPRNKDTNNSYYITDTNNMPDDYEDSTTTAPETPKKTVHPKEIEIEKVKPVNPRTNNLSAAFDTEGGKGRIIKKTKKQKQKQKQKTRKNRGIK